MTELETLALAASLEVNLDLSDDGEHIMAGPRENLTDDLREAIRNNRDALIRTLLVRKAMRYVSEKGGALPLYGAEWEALEEVPEDDLPAFREALRAWARAGLRNNRKGAVA